ncbi:MAG: hypothetical protein ABIB71_01670 [Candidatus Woesearchaeota archaeon]
MGKIRNILYTGLVLGGLGVALNGCASKQVKVVEPAIPFGHDAVLEDEGLVFHYSNWLQKSCSWTSKVTPVEDGTKPIAFIADNKPYAVSLEYDVYDKDCDNKIEEITFYGSWFTLIGQKVDSEDIWYWYQGMEIKREEIHSAIDECKEENDKECVDFFKFQLKETFEKWDAKTKKLTEKYNLNEKMKEWDKERGRE